MYGGGESAFTTHPFSLAWVLVNPNTNIIPITNYIPIFLLYLVKYLRCLSTMLYEVSGRQWRRNAIIIQCFINADMMFSRTVILKILGGVVKFVAYVVLQPPSNSPSQP